MIINKQTPEIESKVGDTMGELTRVSCCQLVNCCLLMFGGKGRRKERRSEAKVGN